MTEHVERPVGSVAEETARLLDALLGQETSPDSSAEVPRRKAARSQTSRSTAGSSAEVPRRKAARSQTNRGGGAEETVGADPTGAVCETCGRPADEAGAGPSPGPAGGAARVCHLCPVCRLISAVRSVSPEAVDRLADLAAAVTEALRDLAATRWAQTGQPAPSRRSATVEDIDVTEVDDGADRDEDVDEDRDDAPDDEEPRR